MTQPTLRVTSGPDGTTMGPEPSRAQLLARLDILQARLRRLKDAAAFERRLEQTERIPGWGFARRWRMVFLNRFVSPQERLVALVLLHQRALLYELQNRRQRAMFSGGRAAALYWLALFVPHVILRSIFWAESKLFRGITRSQRLAARSIIMFPHSVQAGYVATRSELATAEGRIGLRRAMLDEREWTPVRKRALAFIVGAGMVVSWLLAEAYVTYAAPEWRAHKRQADIVFFYGAATRFFLPTPLELVIPGAARVIGATSAVLFASLGAVVGSYLLFLVGDKANSGLRAAFEKRRWTRRAWNWLEQNARRYGYAVLFVVLSIPFAPDSIVIAFALLGLRLPWFLLTIFAATALRLAIFLHLWL